MTEFNMELVDWSRAQFALTAIYHWFFVPLTLGLSFIIAIMETLYVKYGDEEWKRITKFWMKLFGINFAIGVATGIILEFEFGTNWSNYSWLVGDIFGAPLAIEGIMAFFLESTFIAVMFFGWNKVSKKFHLVSTWLVAFGASLSALWILVANAWMQNPVGMRFNPDTARNEMVNFWDVLLSPVAVHKFLHTISSGYVISALFVVGISSWYFLKKRHHSLAFKSMLIGSVFGLLSSLFVVFTGDSSAYDMAQKQPLKFAAMENLHNGQDGAALIPLGIINKEKQINTKKSEYFFVLEIPKLLSGLAYRDFNAFVPGINDILNGNEEKGIISTDEKIIRGRKALKALAEYTKARESNDSAKANIERAVFEENYKYMGYGYFNDKQDVVPNISITFYSFHVMVALGIWFIVLFAGLLILSLRNKIENKKIWLFLALWSIPLGYISSQLGWIISEMGRQPWTIQDILPTKVSTSHLDSNNVKLTFIIFGVLFTFLLIAEIKILLKQIKIGPEK